MVRRLTEWGLASCNSDKIGGCQIRKMVCKSGLKPSIEVRPKQVSVQFSSVAQSCLAPCNPMNRSTPGLPIQHQLPEFTQTHVYRVGDGSNHLIFCCPLLLLPPIPPSIRVFSNESALHIRWPNYWSFSFTSVLPMNTQDWSPLGWTGWICLQSKEPSRVFSNTTVQKHQFLSAQLSL